MCNVYDVSKPLSGQSGKIYFRLESLKEAEDIFGKDLLLENNTWSDYCDKESELPHSTFLEQIDGDFCLCYLKTEKLLEDGGLRKGIDFKLDYEDWNEKDRA
jgi:hypothetical protein